MKWMLTLVVCLVIGPGTAAAERAASPAEATVFIRLVGSVHAEFEEAGRQADHRSRALEIGTGSGFVISPHGYVLTNEHVIRNSVFAVTNGPQEGEGHAEGGADRRVLSAALCARRPSRCFEASVHSSDAALDLAVLFISASDLPYVALGDSDVVRNGQASRHWDIPLAASSPWAVSRHRTSFPKSARRRGRSRRCAG